MWPKFKKIAVIAGALVLLGGIALGVVAAAYLNSPAFGKRILGIVNAHIKGRIGFEDHHIGLVSGRLELSGLTIVQPDGQPAAGIQHLSLGIFWPALAWRTIDIPSLVIDGADVALRHDARDRLNLLQIFESAEPTAPSAGQSDAKPWQVRLHGVQLHRAKFSYERPATGVAVAADRIEAAGGGDLLKRTGRLQLEIFDLAVKAGDIDEQLAQLTVDAAYDDKADLPITLVLKTLDGSVSLQGRIDGTAPTLQLDARCDLDLDLTRLNGWLPQVADLSGRLQGRATLQGPLADPGATLKLVATDGGAAGISFQAVNLEAALAKRQIAIHNLALLGPWGDLKAAGRIDLQPVFPGNLTKAEAAGWHRVPYSLDVHINALKPDQVPHLSLPLRGTWQGDVKLSGAGIRPQQAGAGIEATLAVQGFKTVDTGLPLDGGLAVKAVWQDQILTVEDLRTTLGRTTLQARGSMDWKARTATCDGVLDARSVAGLGAIFDIPLPDGQATLNFSGQGPWSRPTVQATLKGEGLSMAGWRFGNLAVAARLDNNGVVTFSRLAVENSGGRLAGRGRLTLLDARGRLHSDPGIHADLAADQLRLGDFHADLPVDLVLNGQLTLDGRLLQPAAHLELGDTLFRWQDLACNATGTAIWDDGLLTVSRLHLGHGRSTADLSGTSRWRDRRTGSWTADPEVSAEIDADPLRVEEFFPGATGTIAFKAGLKGAVSALEGTFAVNASRLGTSSQTLADVDLQGRLVDNTLHADRLAVTLAPGQQVLGSGWYALDQRFQLALKASNLALARLAALQQWDAVSGAMDLAVNGQGTLDHPHINADLLIHAPMINDRRFDDFRVQLQLQDRLLTAGADLNFSLAGRCRLDSGQFDLSADFNQSDLSSILSLAMKGEWAARLTGHLQAAGNWHHPADIEARVALSDARLDYQAVQLLTIAQLDARLAQGRVSLPPTPVQLMQQGRLIVSADGDIETNLALSADGLLPLAVVAPFTDMVESPRGEIRIAARADGPWQRLQWRAELTAANAGGVLTELDQTLHGVNGRLLIRPDLVQIENLTGKLDDGDFSLDGEVQLSDGRPNQGVIVVKARALPLQWPDTMDLKLSADLTLKGDRLKAGLEGNVVLLEGTYYKRLRYNLLSAFSQSQRAKSVAPAKSPPPWQRAIDLNVAIVSRYPFLVDNNVALLEIAPDLKLTGTVAKPIINGRAQVTEGEVFFRGRTFTVEQGVVDFVNPYKIEPTLDISAQTQIRDWEVTLAVSGTPDNLLIKLSSDPSESDANILSLILLGRISGETSQQNGSSTTTTGEMLAALMTTVWGEEIKKSTGVDILELGTATDEDSTEDTTQLTVGKQLTRRLTIKYALESSSEQTVQRAISEYRLLEHLLASGFQDTAGKYGGELMFRIEFR